MNKAYTVPMRIGVTGASGFIGRALREAIRAKGWQAAPLGRTPRPSEIEGCDAVVHLAGESVDGRWTPGKKAEIERSRVAGTRALADAIGAASRKPRVLVSASAVGYYGDRGDEPLFENSRAGEDFLGRVCVGWEREAERVRGYGVRAVMLRTGIVLGPGGALQKMKVPFRFGAGGPLGGGRQFVPWIHLDDIAALYLHAVETQTVSGPVNAVAPDYATSARFAQALGAAMRRPSLVPAPGIALRAALGEFAQTLLAGQLVIPKKARESGFRWTYPRLEPALQAIVDPSRRSRLLRTFGAEQRIAAPLETVFSYFSLAENLEAITPPSLRFALTSNPGTLREGALIDYRLVLRGAPFRWRTLISSWEPPYRFTDVQLHGPYALWEHVHTFEPGAGGDVVMRDRVTYELPFAPLGGALAGAAVEKEIGNIFAYRARAIAQRFPAS